MNPQKPLKKCCNEKTLYLISHEEADYAVCKIHYDDGFKNNALEILCLKTGKSLLIKKEAPIPQ